MSKNMRKKLKKVHRLFLNSIKKYSLGEVLVGSSVYAREKDLTLDSDLDIICIVEEEKLNDFLNSKYLKGLINPLVAKKIIKGGRNDYFVLKTYLENVLLSIDIISPKFFTEMCNIDLRFQSKTKESYKFGNEPQCNKYTVRDFEGKVYNVKKKNIKNNFGNSIKLPLFFISEKGKYLYGIPTIKYFTSKIYHDTKGILKKNIRNLTMNVLRRLEKEYPGKNISLYCDYFFNLLKGKNKFPKKYSKELKNKIRFLMGIVIDEKKISLIKKEVYELFMDETSERKFSYVRRDWIFPNHLEIMLELVEKMCDKYEGDKFVCKIATILHDTGLVYGREKSSPKGHEKRSIEYAKKILRKYKINSQTQKNILDCIAATDADKEPRKIDSKIVRSADAISQFKSIHFFAKAAFSGDWISYKNWLKRKVAKNFQKICFEDEIKETKIIRDYILDALKLHEKNNSKYPLKDIPPSGRKRRN